MLIGDIYGNIMPPLRLDSIELDRMWREKKNEKPARPVLETSWYLVGGTVNWWDEEDRTEAQERLLVIVSTIAN
jgi:hypothetical protein